MAAQTELAELKKAVEELGQKMDKQMVMVQGLIDLFTSTVSKPNLGLVKEPPQAYHTPAVETKLCSRDMFKDLVEFHEARTHPKGDVGSLSNANAEINSKGKRVHPVDGATLCSCKASKGSTSNPQSNRRNPPRTFSRFSTPLSSVYEKLLKAGFLKPLIPNPSPQTFPASYNPNAYCAFHQMPGHLTDACFRLQHEIQDLIDNGTIRAPPPSKPNVISNFKPQHSSNPHVSQISINSTQTNPRSTIFNPSRYIVPSNQPKPLVSISFEPEVNMMAVGWAVEVYTTDVWTNSDEKLTKEKTDWLRSFNHESLGLLFKGFSQVGAKEAKEVEVLLLGPDIL